ncbi:MAG: CarD family transcriptional regulator [Parvularculaceae bacterium]|nr:CarD family transcriptional regulator [Parvularculaceae bacterium]
MATKTVEKSAKKPAKAKAAERSPASARGKVARSAPRKTSPMKPTARPEAKKPAAKAPVPAKGKAPTAKPQTRPAPADTPPVSKAAKAAPAKSAAKPVPPTSKSAPAKASKAPPQKPELKTPAALKEKPKAKEEAPAKGSLKKGLGEKDKKNAGAAKPAKPAPKKKLFVGQKPRTPKPSDQIVPSTIIAQQKAAPSVNSASVKASPAAVEAKQTFKVNDHIVYPAHGVGRIVSIEKQVIAGITNELFLIEFEQEKMKLRVPTAKAKAVGMRGLSEPAQVKKAIELLKGRARIKRTMWSRRAQEYEAKINSGDIIQVAEVVRDLFRASDQPEQSYSERQLFEAALDRLAREVAAVNKSDLAKAIADLEAALAAKRAAA